MRITKRHRAYLKYRYEESWDHYMDYGDISGFNEGCKYDAQLESRSAKDIHAKTKCDPLHAEQEWSLKDEQKDTDEPEHYVIIKEKHDNWYRSYASYVLKAI